jgi:ParB family chromosome partitioning protein
MPLPKKSKAETEKSVMSILLGDEAPQTKPTPSSSPKTPTPKTPESLPISDLVPFKSHPFKLYDGERLEDMVRSLKELGVIVPIVVRPIAGDEESYEILSGHNRVNAAKKAGLTKIPAVIKTGLTDDEAALIVTETNLVQRSFADLSHSERAIALKQHMDAISKQGKRTDLLDEIERLSNPDEINENGTSDPIGRKLESRELTAEKYGLSPTNVSRYIRLSYISRLLLKRVDSEEIPLRAAVSLSFLSPDEQSALDRLLNQSSYKIDMKKAEAMREFSDAKKLTNEKMEQILSGELNKKPKPKNPPPFKLKAKIYQKYFDGDTPQSEMETIIDQALAEYFENHKEKEDTA